MLTFLKYTTSFIMFCQLTPLRPFKHNAICDLYLNVATKRPKPQITVDDKQSPIKSPAVDKWCYQNYRLHTHISRSFSASFHSDVTHKINRLLSAGDVPYLMCVWGLPLVISHGTPHEVWEASVKALIRTWYNMEDMYTTEQWQRYSLDETFNLQWY